MYEFGYGLSYTNFSIKGVNITTVTKPKEQLPPPPALQEPVLNTTANTNRNVSSLSLKDAVWPESLKDPKNRVPGWFYPYVNKTEELYTKQGYTFPKGYTNTQPKQAHQAGGGSGGNPALWQSAYTVETTIKNTGSRYGCQVPQLYVGYPTDKYENPPRQLRGFEKVCLGPGESTPVKFDLLTRDFSVWDIDLGLYQGVSIRYILEVHQESCQLSL